MKSYCTLFSYSSSELKNISDPPFFFFFFFQPIFFSLSSFHFPSLLSPLSSIFHISRAWVCRSRRGGGSWVCRLGQALSADRRVQHFLILLYAAYAVDDDGFGLESDDAARIGVGESETKDGLARRGLV
jgi:hypothetical protein